MRGLLFHKISLHVHTVTNALPLQLGIGQRALLLQTPHGNILWDCLAYLDEPLIDFVGALPLSLPPFPF
jgi:hypothetical protein